jgi:hypothetical protein
VTERRPIKPPGEVHAMWNAGSKPARMIEVISPAGFEGFFRELIDMTPVGAPDPNAIAALGERYQLPFRSRSLRAASCAESHHRSQAGSGRRSQST